MESNFQNDIVQKDNLEIKNIKNDLKTHCTDENIDTIKKENCLKVSKLIFALINDNGTPNYLELDSKSTPIPPPDKFISINGNKM